MTEKMKLNRRNFLKQAAGAGGLFGERREIHASRQIPDGPSHEGARFPEVNLAHCFALVKIHAPLRNASTISPVPSIAERM